MSFEPDLNWYSKISAEKGIPTRCPYASVHRCPRYYQTLSLLGHAGSTKIEKDTDEKLKRRWEKSDLWPVTLEQETTIFGVGDKQSFIRFCPEVLYDRFGLFAENLHPHGDEINQEALLKLKGPYRADWEYAWSSLTELHYSDCSLYALLMETRERIDHALELDEVVEVKPSFLGFSLNLKVLITRFCVWWLKRIHSRANG